MGASAIAVGLSLIFAGAILAVSCRRVWLAISEVRYQRARDEFYRRREWHEVEFLKLASKNGKPRGLAWKDCEFDDDVAFARERSTRRLRAFVAVTVSFEAIEGGGMEHVEAVSNLRAATAVFHYHGRQWTTDGRAVFNLNPAETIQHFRHELEMVD